jgi:hypothetical protein
MNYAKLLEMNTLFTFYIFLEFGKTQYLPSKIWQTLGDVPVFFIEQTREVGNFSTQSNSDQNFGMEKVWYQTKRQAPGNCRAYGLRENGFRCIPPLRRRPWLIP